MVCQEIDSQVEIDRLNALPRRVSDLNSSAISVWERSLILLNKAKFINASAKEQYDMACSREPVVEGLKNLSASVVTSVTSRPSSNKSISQQLFIP